MSQIIFGVPNVFLNVDSKDLPSFLCNAPGVQSSKDHHLITTWKQKMMGTGVRLVKSPTPDLSLWTLCTVCRSLSTVFPFFWEVAMIKQQGGI